jgi:hypothetical protein
MKEGERLGRWEGKIKPGLITEDSVLNAECGKKKRGGKAEGGDRITAINNE